MAHDQETYRRGRNAALIGLILQILLTAAVAFFGLFVENAAITMATWHVLGGVFIWVVLLLVYNQHRLERIESLEAEQISTRDKQAAAIFSEHADDLDLSRRRLNLLYKYWLNGVSALVAVYLIAMGSLFFLKYYGMVKGASSFAASELITNSLGRGQGSLTLIIGAAVLTFVMFAIGRYISGMTKLREWQLLRGGAAYVMGNFGVMFLILVASVFKMFGTDIPLGLMALVVPAIMMVVGVEILVTFLLSAYRPRRPGEIPRPAFDSRVLGMLTSPEPMGRIISETLNYQFGFEVSRSWFYQQLGRSMTWLTIGALVILLGMSCVVMVPPNMQAVITVFGKATEKSVVDPGMHLKMPWPIGHAYFKAVGEVHQVWVGSSKAKQDSHTAILWTTPHSEGTEKEYLITAPSRHLGDSESTETGRAGLSLLAGEVIVDYRIDNLWQYMTGAEDPSELIRVLADRRVNAYFGSNELDTLLGAGRGPAGETIREQIQGDVNAMNLGVKILFVGITGVHPPADKEVAKSFHDVIGAISKKNATIEAARKTRITTLASVAGSEEKAMELNSVILEVEKLKNDKGSEDQIREKEARIVTLLADASGEAAKLIFEARAYRWSRGISEAAAAARFHSELMAYKAAPDYYPTRQYLATLSEGIADSRKYVLTGEQAEKPEFRLDLHDARSELGGLFEDKK